MPSSYQTLCATQVSQEEIRDGFNDAFANYLAGPIQLSSEQWSAFLARQNIDLALSQIVCAAGRVLAFALIGHRSHSRWRVCTMGTRTSYQGQGLASQLLQSTAERASKIGLAALELEVFEQNTGAADVYRRHGFVTTHALHGYQRAPSALPQNGLKDVPEPAEVNRGAAMRWLEDADAQVDNLPLQVTALSLRAASGQLMAWQHGAAQIVFSRPDEQRVLVHSLIDPQAGQASATALIEALIRRYPAQRIVVPALQRADLGGDALIKAGFQRDALNQLMMIRSLG